MADSVERGYHGNYKFMVEIKGVVQARFFNVTGLATETESFDFQEGGVNEKVHKRMGQTKFSNLVLKRGVVATDNDFTDWRKTITAAGGLPERHDGSIILLNDKGEEVKRWNFVRAWPTKWEGPELNSTGAELAIESLELAHEGVWPA